jgi:hypothetical protein
MDLKHPKLGILFLCALLALLGCENPVDGTNGADGKDGVDGKDGLNALAAPLALTLVGGGGGGTYKIVHPNDATKATNYILLYVEAGDYTKGTYTLGGTTVTPTPVLTNGRMTDLVKIEAPASGTSFTLTVTEGEKTLLEETTVTFDEAGTAAPEVLYGEKFMTFSEFFHDITANIAEIRPSSTVFAAGGYAAEPKKFITAGTRTGNSSAGVAGGNPKWTETDSQPKVDVISSATYGDNPHFVPTQNLAMNYPNPETKADWHEVTGIKTVQVGVDFDLFANADLLKQTGRAVAASSAVLAKVNDITWKAQNTIYKAKYLQPDASWGKRDETVTANTTVAKTWPKAAADRTVGASYGGTWAEKVISVDFAPLPTGLDNNGIWNNYFDYVYAGYVEDSTGHKEPLVWLQNLFSHRGHTNLEAAIQRTGISRMDSLTPAGAMKVVMFAIGFEDIVINTTVNAYEGQSSASIEQGSTFLVSGTGNTAEFKNSDGTATIENKELHVTGLSANALADFAVNGGKLFKGTAEVPTANYGLEYEEEDGEIAITLKDGFFTASAQGSYSFNVTASAGKQYSAIPFTVNRIIARPQLQQGAGAASDAATEATALDATTGGGNITFDNDDFARAILTGGRTVSAITPTVTGGITAVLKATNEVYAIDASVLAAGTTYTLTIRTSGFATATGESLATVTYYIKTP